MNAARRLRTLALVAALATLATACVDDHHDDHSSPDSDTFRQGLVSEGDIALEYGEDGTISQGLNGTPSEIAHLTAGAVGGTNAFMKAHIEMLDTVGNLPPDEATPDTRLWEGEYDGLFLSLYAEKSDTPRGTLFDYTLTGRPAADPSADMLHILSGEVVRIETRPGEFGRQGFGVVRFDFHNYGILIQDPQIDGMMRVSFRRIGDVRQVRVRMIGVESHDDPDFPEAAEYRYTQLPNRGGELRFFGKADVLDDGAPFESVAVASAWRKNRTGIGTSVVFDGSLQVDYWHLSQCWDTALIVGYEKLETPGWSKEEGAAVTCFDLPALQTPEHHAQLPDEDPAIPAAHPAE